MKEGEETWVRRELAHALHDGPLQDVASAKMMLEALAFRVRSGRSITEEDLDRPLKLLAKTMVELRDLVQETRPLANGEDWRVRLENWRNEISGGDTIQIEISENFPAISELMAETLYRVSCEALRNALQHGRGKNIRLIVRAQESGLRWEVTDDGVGFDPDNPPEKHFGVKGMKERIIRIGGEFSVHSRPGEGTRLTAWFPLESPSV